VNTLWRNPSVFESHRRFKEGRDVQDDLRSGQPETQRTDANVNRLWTFVRSDRRLGVRLIAEKISINRETVRQIITHDLGMRIISATVMPIEQKQRRLHFIWFLRNAEMFDRVITGDETRCVQCDPETKRQSMQCRTEFTSAEKITHVSLAVQDQACVFLRLQGDSSLWILSTKTNSESKVLFGSAEKFTAISSEDKTRTLAWQMDSLPLQCSCAWRVKSSLLPGEKSTWLSTPGFLAKVKKVKFSPLQALEALRVVRGWGSHIF
jgi:hypothetical protein